MRVFLAFLREENSSHFKLSITYKKYYNSKRNELDTAIFDTCLDCRKMAAIPQGAFAAYKVRSNMEKSFPWESEMIPAKQSEKKNASQHYQNQTVLENPMKYSSKLMNSIWGLYNRYSVHNFKKNTDANNFFFGGEQLNAAVSSISMPAGQNL